MASRNLVFGSGEIYHVFNRSIAQTPIFKYSKDYARFLDLLNYYRLNPKLSFSHYNRLEKSIKEEYWNTLRKNNNPTTEILAFCLMGNHFHLLLKQTKEKGIKTLASNIQNSYAKYFNTRYKRAGALFQAMFKAVRIETDEQLIHVQRYIHLNPVTAYIVEPENILSYKWSSFSHYLEEATNPFVNTQIILELIGSKEKFKEFVLNQTDYQRELAKIKHLCLEEAKGF